MGFDLIATQESFMEQFKHILEVINGIAWGPFTIILLVGTGLFLTIRLRFVQIRGMVHSAKCISGKYDNPDEEGDVSHFQALCSALSATIGTGNIAGVATAIASGGPGAVFWMWVTAFVGMATKFTCCSLSLKYRKINPDGSASGGPMYYLEKGMKLKWLGVLFALFGMIASFGIGNMVQANSVVDGLNYAFPGINESRVIEVFNFEINIDPKLCIGVVLAMLIGSVIIGGIKRIAKVASKLVPVMTVAYFAGGLFILFINYMKIPDALGLIFKFAFTPYAAAGGVMGYVVSNTIRYGVARGVFSNESGLGSAPIAHAAAKTKEHIREGYVAQLGPFIDTLIVCSITALSILVTGAYLTDKTSSSLTAHAFNTGLPGFGHFIVSFGLATFAFSTMISWSYYGDRCTEYLFGSKAVTPYRWIFCIFVVIGATGALTMIWTISDIMNAFMAIPNLVALIGLSGVISRDSKDYWERYQKGEF